MTSQIRFTQTLVSLSRTLILMMAKIRGGVA